MQNLLMWFYFVVYVDVDNRVSDLPIELVGYFAQLFSDAPLSAAAATQFTRVHHTLLRVLALGIACAPPSAVSE
jgi:hypothetical protein